MHVQKLGRVIRLMKSLVIGTRVLKRKKKKVNVARSLEKSKFLKGIQVKVNIQKTPSIQFLTRNRQADKENIVNVSTCDQFFVLHC